MVCEMAWEVSALDYSNQFNLMWFVTEERISPICDENQLFLINKQSIPNHPGVFIQERSASLV